MTKFSRRQFMHRTAAIGGAAALGPMARPAFADRNDQMNILCWEGYNSDEVLGPFREMNPGASVRAESGECSRDNSLESGIVGASWSG